MATAFIVKDDGKFCRDRGGPMTRLRDGAFCENTTTKGSQEDAKDDCEALGRERRRFCEHCGEAVRLGETVCPDSKCGNTAYRS
ncbi:hypothetical protein Poly21_44180 [Allorhodopirellula heiligendammensis]|uniref:Uncharacterized protein n=1 Tax=Allorhodopirellula heiligendammensis TaxID=2714739 RepID=A0A5C6BEF9_9BACT|nr:hypothetical protein Poly21_44180 [Allorhodopirellula heiligendammensis]